MGLRGFHLRPLARLLDRGWNWRPTRMGRSQSRSSGRRGMLPGLFALGFVWATLLGNLSLDALAGQTGPLPQAQASYVAAQRKKSAVSPPEAELPPSAAAVKAGQMGNGDRPQGQKRSVARPMEPSTDPTTSTTSTAPTAIGGKAPSRSGVMPEVIKGKPAEPPPEDAEYLPEDFFAQLQGPQDWQTESSLEMLPAPKDSHRPETRGVWMTTSDMEVLRDRQQLGEALRQLHRLNFNTIYPVVWSRGYVTYHSDVAKAAGIPQRSRGLQDQDLLADLIQQAHGLGLSVIPWFEYGHMVPPESELALLHPDWLTQKRNGHRTALVHSKPMAWLNPFKTEVQDLMRDLVVDLVSHYNVDGIQFDDHMSLPRDYGYDELTRSRYQAETGQPAPLLASDRAWTQWRADQLTYAMANLHRAVKSAKPKLIFSISPNRYDYAYQHYLQDWKAWVERGIVDELIVQAYRHDYRDFVADLRRPEIRQAKAQIPTSVGILTGLRDRRIGMYQIKQQVRAAQAEGLGVSFFFYQSLWDNAPESIAERKSGFRSIFPQSVPRIARV